MDGIYDDDGAVIPSAFDAYLEAEGVDVAIMFCEYSPLSTGIQPIEDLLPLAAANPDRLRFLANVNPYLHDPLLAEVDRPAGPRRRRAQAPPRPRPVLAQ